MAQASKSFDGESEFGGVPGLVPPREKIGDYEPHEYLSALYTMDSTNPSAVPDPANIGKDMSLTGWDGKPAEIG